MAYELTPVAEQLKQTPQMSMADMVNVGRGVQGYQSGQIALEQQDVANKEQQAVATAMKANPGLLMTDNQLDMDKVNTIIPQLAPRTNAKYLQEYSVLHGAQSQALSAKQNLDQGTKNLVGQVFNVLGKAGVTEKSAYLNALDELQKTNPNNKILTKLLGSYKTIWEKMPDGTNFPQVAITGAQTLLSVAQQEAQFNPQPGTLDTGAQILPTVTRPSVAGQAPSTQVGQMPLAFKQLGPGSRYVATGRFDMNNNPTALAYGPNGELLGEVTIPAGAGSAMQPGGPAANLQPRMPQPQIPLPGPTQPVAPQTPSTARPLEAPVYANAPVRLPAGENATTQDAATALRLTARNIARDAPMNQFNNNQIIKLADQTTTGKGAELWANLTGGYALLPKTSSDAENLKTLGHYMSQQTAALANGTGLGATDAGRAIAGQLAGTTEWPNQTIKSTARINRSLSTGGELFSQGVENAFERTKNPFSAVEFQNRWSQTLGNEGINAIRLYDAIKNKDQDAIKEVVTQVGGPNSVGYKTLSTKIQDMQKLIGGK